jgi:hypothetical protein
MHTMLFSQNGLVLDHPMPIGTTVNGHYYSALVQDNVRPGGRLFAVNIQNCFSMVSFCSRAMQYLITITVCKI